MADVAGMQPAVLVEDVRSGGRVIQVALHHLRAANQDLAVGLGAELFSSRDVDHLAFGPGNYRANRSHLYPIDVVAHQVSHWAGLGHAVPRIDRAVEPPAGGLATVRIRGR